MIFRAMAKPKSCGTVQKEAVVAQTASRTVLIVDDEPIVRESLRDWLIAQGYQVATAGDGEQALEMLQEQDFGVVVLGLRLPGKDGRKYSWKPSCTVLTSRDSPVGTSVISLNPTLLYYFFSIVLIVEVL